MPEGYELLRVPHRSGGESRTKQSDALATDVNAIVKRWISTGVVPVSGRRPTYGDFSNVDDYLTAMNKVRAAEAEFQALPAHIRKYVDNDAGEFLRLVYDPARRGELEELGLVEQQAPEAAPPADVPAAAVETPPAPEPPGEGAQ